MVWSQRAAVGFCLFVAAGAAVAAPAAYPLTIDVVSNRADLISGGDALVRIRGLSPLGAYTLHVDIDGRDVSDQFAWRANRQLLGLVTGLSPGKNRLTASVSRRRGAWIDITNHPNGGPVFAGPQVMPWVCQDGALDAQCNAPVAYTYKYMPAGVGDQEVGIPGIAGANLFQDYDPANPPDPSLVATVTTDQGNSNVPFIVRVETGYMDRDQYAIATLFDPDHAWTVGQSQRGWNGKLLITHGASCGIDHQAGTAPDVLDASALGRGFAVLSTALDNAGHNCSVVTQAESLVMVKEHFVEQYGAIRYTIGTGCSGGSLTQYQVANAYPGVYQGILPQCSFPDAWSTGQQLVDYHLVRQYVENPAAWGSGVIWDPLSIAAVEGHPNHVNSIILDSLYLTALGDPTNACAGVSAEERYDPAGNPMGVRCTLADYMVNVLGRRPDGFAGRPLDNVGVQYGLSALMAGTLTPAQFADINARVGGADIDVVPTAERTAADEPALLNAYRSGGINSANNLDNTAIIDLRGTDQGEFHDVYRAFAIRARLEREHGSFANQAIWQGTVPLLGDVNYTTQGLLAMDRWLAAIEADRRHVPLAQKVVEDKPADIHDQCTDGAGHVIPNQTVCELINPVFTTPRVVAGESIATDTNKCRLKPLHRADYTPVQFSDDQWTQLATAFPTGVCDWSRPGVDQRGAVPWMTYADRVGGRPMGLRPRSTPFGS
jgi:hypothetical protein